MKSKKTILLLLFFCHNLSTNEANYGNIFARDESPFGVTDNRVRLHDVLIEAKRCASSERFICIQSKVFVFAVPRNNSYLRTWSHANAKYEVLFEKSTLFRQQLIKYKIIKQIWNGMNTEYAYSSEYGVVGIKAENGNQLMLMDKCGFAVLSEAKGCKPD